jgi:hypothetical protein
MSEQDLQRLAQEARAAVAGLQRLLERDYVKRDEAEKQFMLKKVSQRRWFAFLLMIPLALGVSFFVTIGTVSSCFLGGDGQAPPAACKVIPGFEEAITRNEGVMLQFQGLIDTTEENRKRLVELERELRELKRRR